MSPTELYAAGPEGVLFGRNFDLALIAWHVGDTLPCQLFESKEIPSIDNYWIGEDAGGGNIGGYQNAEFDRLCEIAQNAAQTPQVLLPTMWRRRPSWTKRAPLYPYSSPPGFW